MKESTNEVSLSTEEILPTKDEEGHHLFQETTTKEKTEENEEIQIEQEKVNMDLLNLDISLTNAADVLRTMDISDRDNYRLIKFQIRVRAVYIYKWEVLHIPNDIKKLFKSMREEINKKSIKINEDILSIFDKIDLLDTEYISQDTKQLEEDFKIIFQEDKLKSLISLKEFFSIGLGSFNQYNNGNKPFEGYARKRSEPYCFGNLITKLGGCMESLAYKYEQKWIILKDDSIYYSDKSYSEKGNDIYFFTDSMKVTRSKKKILIISGAGPDLILKFSSFYERELWNNEITHRMEKLKKILDYNIYGAYTNEKLNNQAYWFIDGKDYYSDLKKKLEEAKETVFITDWWMSPEVWLERPIDSKVYMALEFQKKDRKEQPPFSRLKDILYQLALKGVKIYILVYQECSYALTLDSEHTQKSLEKLHPNIIVTRHPYGLTDLLWSHHEKLVIIDQITAYVGGLDLCWGRWDTHEHPIVEESNPDEKYFWPGIDYSNGRINDFNKVKEYLIENVDRTKKPRMPWHDVHCRLIGPVVNDIARHFVQRWNISRGDSITDIKQSASTGQKKRGGIREKEEEFIPRNNTIIKVIEEETVKKDDKKDKKDKKDKNGTNKDLIMKKKDKTVIKRKIKKKDKKEEEDKKEGEKEDEKEDEKEEEKQEEKQEEKEDEKENEKDGKTEKKDGIILINKGKKVLINKKKQKEKTEDDIENIEVPDIKLDYNELRQKCLLNYEVVDQNHLYRSKPKLRGVPNMKEIRDMYNINIPSKQKKEDFQENDNDNTNNINTNSERNSFYNNFIQSVGKAQSEKIIGKSYINKIIEKSQNQILIQNVNQNFFGVGTKSRVQVLRSVCEWCTGMDKIENSILKAYYHLIENSKNYIFIENQFFVSKSYDKEEENTKAGQSSISSIVKNEIALKIRKRIEKAYINQEKFRVFVFIPLLPGFAGDPDEGTIQIILGHTYAGICRNNGLSIIEELEKMMGEKWKDYIGFYSLRGHGVLNGVPITELIYIHSKLMIVDDESVIIGSANINDRSMLGSRDSEFCVLIKETLKYDSIMDGQEVKKAKFAVTLRKALMAEHLGIKPDDEILEDPLNNKLLELIKETANNNTLIFRELFNCYPDDEMKTFKDAKNSPKMPLSDSKEIEKLQKKYKKEKDNIKGHIVEFPLHFLEKENLGAGFLGIYSLVPEHNFT